MGATYAGLLSFERRLAVDIALISAIISTVGLTAFRMSGRVVSVLYGIPRCANNCSGVETVIRHTFP